NPRDLYNVPGIVTNYINVIDNMHAMTGFNNVVEVTIGNPVILINGEEFEMPVAAYISPVSQAAMVPVRFVSVALGLEEDAVRWDPTTSTVTIDTGINNRIVQFVSNETFYRVNGAQISMVGADNVTLVASEIREERMFIPFRQLGNAFGIPVSWDAETTTAFYNNPAEFAGIQ
ncbi:MAG: copper amine oxidase N-terminal domain-containing protein, partial [Defluviitaleaceae bacterium]|nr:copper amine oxidase N-terminal domain-containing protein [Defluviitaleaceae bacterium]